MSNEKILIGKKGNDMFSGYIFCPYIKISEMVLPIKMVSWNNGNPIFTKQASFMSNEKYNQIIDEVYENYKKNTPEQHVAGSDSDIMRYSMIYKNKLCPLSGYPIFERLSKEEFINKCKTDTEFSEKWELKIEERELSWEEQVQWAMKNTDVEWENLYIVEEIAKETTPKRLLTVTYKDEKIESYE